MHFGYGQLLLIAIVMVTHRLYRRSGILHVQVQANGVTENIV